MEATLFDKLILNRINFSRQETVLLSLLMNGNQVLTTDFVNAGVPQNVVSTLSKSINSKFRKANINLKIVCMIKRGKRYPHVRCLVEHE